VRALHGLELDADGMHLVVVVVVVVVGEWRKREKERKKREARPTSGPLSMGQNPGAIYSAIVIVCYITVHPLSTSSVT
jgi:hypothetical protein